MLVSLYTEAILDLWNAQERHMERHFRTYRETIQDIRRDISGLMYIETFQDIWRETFQDIHRDISGHTERHFKT